MCVLLFGAVTSGWAQTTVYFPQIADGAFGETFFTTTIFVSNPASSGSSSVTITFTTASGEAFDLPVVDTTGQLVNSGNTITIANLGPGESRKFVSTGESAGRVGFAIVTSSAPIAASAIF